MRTILSYVIYLIALCWQKSMLVQKIVKVAYNKVVLTVLNVHNFLTGVHSRVKSIKLRLKYELANVQILVICGIKGIGTSTIAKFVCSLNWPFTCMKEQTLSAYIRENGLVTLQELGKRKRCTSLRMVQVLIKISYVNF